VNESLWESSKQRLIILNHLTATSLIKLSLLSIAAATLLVICPGKWHQASMTDAAEASTSATLFWIPKSRTFISGYLTAWGIISILQHTKKSFVYCSIASMVP
jgi:hypothetical protein